MYIFVVTEFLDILTVSVLTDAFEKSVFVLLGKRESLASKESEILKRCHFEGNIWLLVTTALLVSLIPTVIQNMDSSDHTLVSCVVLSICDTLKELSGKLC